MAGENKQDGRQESIVEVHGDRVTLPWYILVAIVTFVFTLGGTATTVVNHISKDWHEPMGRKMVDVEARLHSLEREVFIKGIH